MVARSGCLAGDVRSEEEPQILKSEEQERKIRVMSSGLMMENTWRRICFIK